MRRASIALVLASVLWGPTGTAASLLPGTVSPVAVGAATMGVGGILLFGLSARRAVTVLGDRAARPWLLLGLLAGLSYALYTYASSRAIGPGHGPRGVMGGMFGVGAVGPMLVAYLLFGIGLAMLRSSSATTITLVEPLVATVLAVMVVGQRLGVVGWIGLGLILSGVTAMTAARHPEKSP